MKITFKTFGCRLNISETESIIAQVKDWVQISDDIDEADIVVINSCTVTNKAEKKCLRLINNILNKNKFCVVTGCFNPTLFIQNPKLFYLSLDNKALVHRLIQNIINNNSNSNNNQEDYFCSDQIEFQKNRFLAPNLDKRFHSRAFLKIQDGCNNSCSYCKVRIVRGKEQSLPFYIIENHLRDIFNKGFNEVVLTGINIAAYNDNNINFSSLIEKLIKNYSKIIFQLSSIEINNLDNKFFELIKNKSIKPYFHLPLQSGSDCILSLMNRSYNISKYIKTIEKIKLSRPDSFFSTDLIVGFPGENKLTLKETEKVIRYIGFHHLHLFPFSKREETLAFNMKETLSNNEKSYYIKRLYQIIKPNKQSFINSFIGSKDFFLVEDLNQHYLKGKSYHNININVECFNTVDIKKGAYLQVLIYGKKDEILLGRLLGHKDE